MQYVDELIKMSARLIETRVVFELAQTLRNTITYFRLIETRVVFESMLIWTFNILQFRLIETRVVFEYIKII